MQLKHFTLRKRQKLVREIHLLLQQAHGPNLNLSHILNQKELAANAQN